MKINLSHYCNVWMPDDAFLSKFCTSYWGQFQQSSYILQSVLVPPSPLRNNPPTPISKPYSLPIHLKLGG